jgi:hypothetical protein
LAISSVITTAPADSAKGAFDKINANFTSITDGGNAGVAVTTADTTAKVLNTKLVAGTHVTTTVVNPGGDETLRIDVENTKILVDGSDTTEGYLFDKITAGNNISTAVSFPGGDEKVVINALDHYVQITNADTTSDYLNNKLVANDGVQLDVLNPAGNEQLQVSVPQAALQHIPVNSFTALAGSIDTIKTYHRGMICPHSSANDYISTFVSSRAFVSGTSSINVYLDLVPSGTATGDACFKVELYDQSVSLSDVASFVASGTLAVAGSSWDTYQLKLGISGIALSPDVTTGIRIFADRTVVEDTLTDPMYVTGVNLEYILD